MPPNPGGGGACALLPTVAGPTHLLPAPAAGPAEPEVQVLVSKTLTYSDVSTNVARTGRVVLPRLQVGSCHAGRVGGCNAFAACGMLNPAASNLWPSPSKHRQHRCVVGSAGMRAAVA